MTHFIKDNTSPGAQKTDYRTLAGIPDTKKVTATDWEVFRQALLDIQEHLRGGRAGYGLSVLDRGAKGDNTTNDAAAIQSALTEAASASGAAYGHTVYLPKGTYRIGSKLTIPNGVRLVGAGPAATVIKATNTFNATAMIENAAFQEFTFLEGLTVDGNESGGAVCSTAVVNLTSMFINSFMRDVVITEGSNVGLRIAADNAGMGPFYVENCWLLRNNGHNLLVEETAANTGAVHGIVFVNLTSEHQPGGKSAIMLKGLGRCQGWAFFNVHIEMTNAGGADTTGITIDGVSRVLLDNVQILSGNAGTISAGIRITNVAQNLGIQIRNVNNNNVINPIVDDLKNGFTIAGVNVSRYETPDVHFLNFQTLEAGALIQRAVGTAIGGANPSLDLDDTTAAAAGVGASLRFKGAFTGSSLTSAAEIKASKANGTAGDFGFDLKFATRVNGGALVESVRLLSDFRSAVFFGQTRMTNELVPAQITANQNDYNPAGLSDASVLLINSDAARDVTGFATGAAGRWLWVYNTGAFSITLKHLVTSSANNQIRGRGGADTILTPNTGVQLYYSPSLARWVVMTDTL